jgi:hypothetical protein
MAHRGVVTLLIFVVTLVTVPAGRAQEPFPVPVFVTELETPPLPPLRPEAHEAAISQTREEMLKIAERLRKQHGDKTGNWPPEVWKEFYVAEDANTLAVAHRDYQRPETRLGLADSVEDFRRGAGGNKGMTMVTTAEEASLVVQITGRRRISAPGPTDNRYFIRFRLTPGAKMSPERFHELTYGYKWNTPWAKLIAHPKDPSPYVDLEAGSPASWKNGAGLVRAVVDAFIKERVDPAKKKS